MFPKPKVGKRIEPPFVYPTHAGYSLKQTCEANGLPPKTGDGGNAAIQFERGISRSNRLLFK